MRATLKASLQTSTADSLDEDELGEQGAGLAFLQLGAGHQLEGPAQDLRGGGEGVEGGGRQGGREVCRQEAVGGGAEVVGAVLDAIQEQGSVPGGRGGERTQD